MRAGAHVGVIGLASVAGVALAQPQFEDISIQAFIKPPVHKHTDFEANGATVMTGGLAVGDFNRDGHQDLFVLSGNFANDKLYLNLGNGAFVNAASAAGVALRHHGAGVAVGDYDNNGFLDIYVTTLGVGDTFETGANLLYKCIGLAEDGFTPLFEEVAEAAGVNVSNPFTPDGFGAAFGDYDLDGDLDLATAGWVGNDCDNLPDQHARVTTGNQLFRNNGDGTFTNVTAEATPLNTFECWTEFSDELPLIEGFAPRFADMNNDGWPDLLITADNGFTSDHLSQSLYLINQGDGAFVDGTNVPGSGLGIDSNGMGQAVGDLDNDGDLDWYVTSICNPGGQAVNSCNVLYMNNGDDTFTDQSVELKVHEGYWGWGAEIVDLDLDGWQDIIATGGWGSGGFAMQPTRLWMSNGLTQQGELRPFAEASASAGLLFAGQGRGLVRFDCDSDGDVDIAILPNSTLPAYNGEEDQTLAFYGNLARQSPEPEDAHYLRVFLDTSLHPCLAPDGMHARVIVTTQDGSQLREITGGSTYNSQSELSAHFGLGATSVVSTVRVEWPNGLVTELTDVPADQTLEIAAPCAADADGNGVLNILDFQAFQAAFIAGNAPAADIDCDRGLSITDFVAFQSLFGQKCGG